MRRLQAVAGVVGKDEGIGKRVSESAALRMLLDSVYPVHPFCVI